MNTLRSEKIRAQSWVKIISSSNGGSGDNGGPGARCGRHSDTLGNVDSGSGDAHNGGLGARCVRHSDILDNVDSDIHDVHHMVLKSHIMILPF